MRCFPVLSALVAAASAIEILQPDDTAHWDFSAKNTITWKNVSIDPPSFNIVLVNGATSPPSTTVIAKDVKTADNQYSFSNLAATPGSKYTIEFMGTSAQSSGILAQSKEFVVTKSGTAANATSGGSGSPTGTQTPGTTGTPHPNGAVSMGGSMGVAVAVAAAVAGLL